MFFILTHILNAIILIIGLLFIYTSLFVYEDDQKRLQNKLADIILETSIYQDRFSKTDLLVKTLYGRKISLIDKFLGYKKIFSFKAIGRLGLLSFSSFFIFWGLIFDAFWMFSLPFLLVGILILYIALYSGKRNENIPFFIFIILFSALQILYWFSDSKLEGAIFSVVTIISTLSSILCAGFTFILLKKFSKISLFLNKWYLVVLSYIGLILALALVYFFSIILMEKIVVYIDKLLRIPAPDRSNFYPIVFVIIAVMSQIATVIFLLLFDLSFLLLFIFAGVNNFIWRIIRFPLRAIYEHKLVRNRKVIGSLGLLIVYSIIPQLINFKSLNKLVDLLK